MEKKLSGTKYITTGLVEVHNIKQRHDELAREMTRRGYHHKSPLPEVTLWTEGHVDSDANLVELARSMRYNPSPIIGPGPTSGYLNKIKETMEKKKTKEIQTFVIWMNNEGGSAVVGVTQDEERAIQEVEKIKKAHPMAYVTYYPVRNLDQNL